MLTRGRTRTPTRRPAVVLVGAALLLAACSSDPTGSAGTHDHRTHDHGASPGATTSHAEAESEAVAAAPATVPLRPGERSQTLRIPGGPYTPQAPGGGLDDYRCFLVDPGLSKAAYVTGSDVLPGNADVVHHAILYTVEPDQVAAAERHDAATAGRGWTCFGGSALPNRTGSATRALDSAPWLAGWAPGGGETVFRGGTGKRLEAGSRIVLQLHYNLREGTDPDDTAVKLRLMPGTADLDQLQTMLLVAPVELPCLPDERGPLCDRSASMLDLVSRFGQASGRTVSGLQLLCDGSLVAPRAGPTQSCDRRVDTALDVRAVAGHMHLLGRSIQVELRRASGATRTLLDRPVWDFDDQGATPLPRPVRVRPGDVLRVTCTHDAALRSLVPELECEHPRYVTWGEGTSDEMCLGTVVYTRP
jgi:hypothetical protein